MVTQWQTLETLADFNMGTPEETEGRHFGCLMAQPSLVNRIIEAQGNDEKFQSWFDEISTKEPTDYKIGNDGGRRF
mgnify:FL=1